MKRFAALSLVLALVASPVLGQTLPYYVTDGDAETAYIIQNGVLQGTFSTTDVGGNDDEYPIAVVADVRIADDVNLDSAVYSLAGVFTGTTFSGGGVDFDEMLDGTTNGSTFNYGCQFGGGSNMVRADRNWQGGTSIFVTPYDMTGCTYDTATDTIWVIDDSAADKGIGAVIRQLSLTGSELSSFTPGVPGRLCCLAYDFTNDSLWFMQNELAGKTSGEETGSGRGPAKGGGGGDRTLFEYSKAGARLDAFIVPGFDPSNPWGGEMPIASRSATVPAMSRWGIVALLLLVTGTVLVVARHRHSTA